MYRTTLLTNLQLRKEAGPKLPPVDSYQQHYISYTALIASISTHADLWVTAPDTVKLIHVLLFSCIAL